MRRAPRPGPPRPPCPASGSSAAPAHGDARSVSSARPAARTAGGRPLEVNCLSYLLQQINSGLAESHGQNLVQLARLHVRYMCTLADTWRGTERVRSPALRWAGGRHQRRRDAAATPRTRPRWGRSSPPPRRGSAAASPGQAAALRYCCHRPPRAATAAAAGALLSPLRGQALSRSGIVCDQQA